MKVALAVCAFCLLQISAASAQCNAFIPLKDDAQQKAAAVRAATEQKTERKEICVLVTQFTAAEAAVVKFLVDNETLCGIPDQVIKTAKTEHQRTLPQNSSRPTVNVGDPKIPSFAYGVRFGGQPRLMS